MISKCGKVWRTNLTILICNIGKIEILNEITGGWKLKTSEPKLFDDI